MVKEVQHR